MAPTPAIPGTPAPAHWCFFDVDGTVIAADSFAAFLADGFRRSPWRALTLLLLWPLVLSPLLGCDLRWAKSAFLWMFTVGLAPKRALLRLRSIGTRAQSAWMRPVAFQTVAALRGQGMQICYVSASPSLWLRPLLDRFDGGPKQIIGTRLRYFAGGLVIAGRDCRGAEKVRRIEAALGRELVWSCAYGDHPADIPLLARARQRFVVNPKPRHLRLFNAALGDTFDVLMWG